MIVKTNGSFAALMCSSAVSVQALELLIYSRVSPRCQPLIPGGFSQKIRTANCYTSIFGRQDNEGNTAMPRPHPATSTGGILGALDLKDLKTGTKLIGFHQTLTEPQQRGEGRAAITTH